MKTASGSLIALLNSSVQFKMADLLLLSNLGDTAGTLAMSSTDFAINDGSNTYQPSGSPLIFKRSRTKMTLGLEVDSMDIELMGTYDYTGTGVMFQQFVANGGLDNTRVQLQRAFMPEWGDTSPGFLWMFSGRVADVQLSRNTVRIKVNSDLELLDTPYPRNLYQKGCTNTLFDAGCGVVRASYSVAGAVLTGSTKTSINLTSAQPTDYGGLGVITFTSGNNVGARRTIKSFTAGTPANIGLSLPLPYTPAISDTFNWVPGCDKTKGTNGCAKFSNTARYRGCRFIPRPETIR